MQDSGKLHLQWQGWILESQSMEPRDYTRKTTATYVSAADERVAQGRTSRHMGWESLEDWYTCSGPSDRVIRKKKLKRSNRH